MKLPLKVVRADIVDADGHVITGVELPYLRDADQIVSRVNLFDELVGTLHAIHDYAPREIVKDEFAYDRIVEAYREAARATLAKVHELEKGGKP